MKEFQIWSYKTKGGWIRWAWHYHKGIDPETCELLDESGSNFRNPREAFQDLDSKLNFELTGTKI